MICRILCNWIIYNLEIALLRSLAMNQETDSETETDRSLSPCVPSCFASQPYSLEDVEAALRHIRCVETHRLVKVLKLVRPTKGSSQ
jgi:Cft2 family RNA processing exonuclease